MKSCFGCWSFFSKRDHSQLKVYHTFSGYKKIDEAFDEVSRQMCWLDLAIQDPTYPSTPIAREIKNTMVSLRDCYPQGSGAYRQCWCQLGVILKSLPTHKAQLSWVRKTQQRHNLLSKFHYHEPGFKQLCDKVISGLGSFVNIESLERYPDQHYLIVPISPRPIVVDLFTFDCLTLPFFQQIQSPRHAYLSPLRLATGAAVGLDVSNDGNGGSETKMISF